MTSLSNPLDMHGKAALVTGAGAGIGAACVRQMLALGAKVLATDIDAEGLAALASAVPADEELAGKAANLVTMQHDVTNEQHWREAVAAIIENFAGFDALVNNAGGFTGGAIAGNCADNVSRILDLNVISIFLGMQQAAEAMRPGGPAGQGGSIVNVASVASAMGIPGHSAYGATKGAVAAFTRHAAVEFQALGYGVRVNSIHPGLIETQMAALVLQDFIELGMAEDAASAIELVHRLVPMKRVGQVEEIARAIAFLASGASSYTTGIELFCDGGAQIA